MPARTCSDGYSKRRIVPSAARTGAPHRVLGIVGGMHQHANRRKFRFRRPCAAHADVAVRIHGERGRQVVTVRCVDKSFLQKSAVARPDFAPKHSAPGSRGSSWPNYTRRCCRHGRRHTSCVGPRRHVVCLPERVEPPDSAAMRRSAIRTSCSSGMVWACEIVAVLPDQVTLYRYILEKLFPNSRFRMISGASAGLFGSMSVAGKDSISRFGK